MKSALIGILFCLFITAVNGNNLYTTSAGGVGAVYTMTNGATMNQVIIYRLNSTGQLTWVSTVNTNGTGVNTTATDPLFSQGSMTVFSNYLFVVNAGSNTLSMFMINSMDATQLTLVSVQSTYGWFPISVTVNSKYACVLTGGNQTGIRCFTYNSSGLFLMSSFDRDLTSYISQTIPPTGPPETLSEILFSADGLSLIVSVKGYNTTVRGYLLFYQLTNNTAMLSSTPSLQTPPSGILPFSMTLVGTNGLLITDPGAQGVLTQSYSSTSGTITNSILTPVNPSLAGALCWSTYSPSIGNYYVIGASTATIVELNLNLSSNSIPVTIVQYYQLPNNTGALETTVVTLASIDYLYVIGTTAQVITSYQLNAPGNASSNGVVIVQQNMTSIPKIAGIAAYVQIRSSAPLFFQKTAIIFWSIAIFFSFYYVYEME
jgi:hypothetical protein